MKKYNIYVENSNGTESLFRENVLLESDEKAQKLIDDLDDSTGFDHRFEFVEEVEDEATEEVETTDEETESTETEKQEEDSEVEDSTSQIDFDWDEDEDDSAFPRGWHRRSEYVSGYGTVYHKGEEVPDLFRTKKPTE